MSELRYFANGQEISEEVFNRLASGQVMYEWELMQDVRAVADADHEGAPGE